MIQATCLNPFMCFQHQFHQKDSPWDRKNILRIYLRRDAGGHHPVISNADDIAPGGTGARWVCSRSPAAGLKKIQHKQAIALYADYESLHSSHMDHLQSHIP